MIQGHPAGEVVNDAAAGTLRRPFADGARPARRPPGSARTGVPETTTMASPNRARVERCLDLLRRGLAPFIERELRRAVEARRQDAAFLRTVAANARQEDAPLAQWDAAALLRTMWDLWNPVFRSVLGIAERSLVSELRTHRNNWAHQKPFSDDDAYRAVDSAARLLTAVSAPEATELADLKTTMLRERFAKDRPRPDLPPPRRSRDERTAPGGVYGAPDTLRRRERPHELPAPRRETASRTSAIRLRPLPAEQRQPTPPLTGPGNGFEFLKPVLAAIGDGVSHSFLVSHLRTVHSQWKAQRAAHYLDRIRNGLRVIEQRVATIRLTASGRALRQTGNPDALREWLLTGLLGFDHLLVWMSAAPRPKSWLLDELRQVNRRWTTDNYPRSLLNWTLWLNLSEETDAGFTLTRRGRAWRSLIHWNPEPLN